MYQPPGSRQQPPGNRYCGCCRLRQLLLVVLPLLLPRRRQYVEVHIQRRVGDSGVLVYRVTCPQVGGGVAPLRRH